MNNSQFRSISDDESEGDDFRSIPDQLDNRPTAYIKFKVPQNRTMISSYTEHTLDRRKINELLSKSQFVEPHLWENTSSALSRSSLHTEKGDIRIPLLSNLEIPEMNPRERKKVQRRQTNTRLEQLRQRTRPQRAPEVSECSADTSAALIRLMVRTRCLRYFINIYIWINIVLRCSYYGLVIYYMVKLSDPETSWNDGYFWWLVASLCWIRIMYPLIIYKLLHIGEQTRDKKIKIVYETYVSWFEETSKQINQKQQQINEISIHTPEDEAEVVKLQREIKKLNHWLLLLKTWVVLIPPELCFVALKKTSNGFFQVQNYILKSLDVVFFTPPFIVFLLRNRNKQVEAIDFFTFNFEDIQIMRLMAWTVTLDLIVFWMLVFMLLYQNLRTKKAVHLK